MSFGKINEFNVSTGNWSLYVERLEMYFKVNKVDAELWMPTLITAIGDEAYEVLSSLASPKKPAEITYDAAVKMLKDHLQPKPSVMAERYRFRQRRQRDGETIAQYITELKKLSKLCDFGTNLEDSLRDQLVCGVVSDVIRQRLFAEDNLNYASAVKLACSLEAAERNAAVVECTAAGVTGNAGLVHAVRAKRGLGSNGRARFGQANNYTATRNCTVCGNNGHSSEECRYRKFICSKCKKRGHLRRVCPESPGNNGPERKRVNHVRASGPEEESDENSSTDDIEEKLHQLCLSSYKPVSLEVFIDGVSFKMEIDTGSSVSCISKATYNKYFKERKLESSDLIFKFYDGSSVKPLGIIKPMVQWNNKRKRLELFVIDGGTTSLLGRHWLTELGIKIPPLCNNNINKVKETVIGTQCDSLKMLIDRHKQLFSEGLGRFTGGRARLRVREGAAPVFHRARPLPYALKPQVDAELDCMLRDGIIEPVEASDWATPLVPVRKADGGLRICADYKVTLNPVLLVDRYPLPKIEDLLVSLNGAQLFSKIDLSQAYNQVELDETKELTVINTHRGLFKYNRLVFGLSSSPGIFQRIMSNLLSDIPGVEVFLDDVIIATRGGPSEHLITLEKVLHRLSSNGMKLKKSKCSFLVEEVRYLGYIISKDGVKVDPDKVEAIVRIPRPEDITQLRSFLGIVNFYAKFVKNISTILFPLYKLLKKGVTWKWSKDSEMAFNKIKNILTSAEGLAHYDPSKPLTLTCDASAKGIGGVLTQRARGGAERPVVFASRALTDAEKHYSQIDREALAIVFCLQKLHQYLYGRRFTLRTDHKPLVSIFGPKHGIPAMAASRMQRWAVILSAYSYDIEYVNTKLNGADGLSRLPVSARSADRNDSSLDPPEQTYLHFAQDELLLDSNIIKRQTLRDPLLSRILLYVREGWPDQNDIRELQPYFNRKNELYEELGCIMWGHRVIIPEKYRSKVLDELHEAHMGICKTKALARSYVWWAGLDEAVEALCRGCAVCAAEADAPPRHAVTPWPWPAKAWSRVHLDFLGPFHDKTYLILVDARTKWIEVYPVPSTAARYTLNKLEEVFARWGLPRQLVTDNGPPFTSSDFAHFMTRHGIEHIFSAPYHPASNGAAENAVRTIKRAIKKAIRKKEDIQTFLNKFLLHYRNTEHCTTGESPANLMLGRQLRTKLDLLRPDRNKKVRDAQARQVKSGPDGSRGLEQGEEVWIRQYHGNQGTKWLPGKVIERLGTTDYKTLDLTGKGSHKHIDQLRRRSSRNSLAAPSPDIQEPSAEGQRAVPMCEEQVQSRACPRGESERDSRSTVDLDKDVERFSDALASPAPATDSPALVTPPRTRPIRKCRIENPPQYVFK
ncbi:hypothetical protein ABMA27_015532 [Loxostege sticticalis]|uniref:RNA-directed DNA polymerase n=1 Tax=Loxostege sticticalis TaxID=481309 RepID=A0ABR3I808_LOXSC